MFPSDSCVDLSSTKGNAKWFTKMGHANADQQPSTQQYKLISDEILGQDQSRVNSIHSRSKNGVSFMDSSTTVPTMDGSIVGSGDYIVTIGLGTPVKKLSLIIDTANGLTWTQCKPCDKTCYHQRENIFVPDRSTSYKYVPCKSAICDSLWFTRNAMSSCSYDGPCHYIIQYEDSSFSKGYYSMEKLSLTSTDGVDEFFFGCGDNNQVNFSGAAGILGLGRDDLSLNHQASGKYNNIFYQSKKSNKKFTGFLSFGPTKSKSPTVYTPISNASVHEYFYNIDITAINVDGRKLPISASVFSNANHSMIDSGTAITRLPPAAYSALRSAFRKQMSGYPIAPPLLFLDTCYDLTKYKSVNVNIDSSGILYAKKVSQVCLAFAGNGNANDVTIFGNVQQRTMEVVYDGAMGRIGFPSDGCS
ncbi:Aspartyl protease family protein At5g10770 [Linum perenne]